MKFSYVSKQVSPDTEILLHDFLYYYYMCAFTYYILWIISVVNNMYQSIYRYTIPTLHLKLWRLLKIVCCENSYFAVYVHIFLFLVCFSNIFLHAVQIWSGCIIYLVIFPFPFSIYRLIMFIHMYRRTLYVMFLLVTCPIALNLLCEAFQKLLLFWPILGLDL